MKSKYDLYRPQKFIRDVYTTDKSYYRAPDIALSPQMTIGSLSKSRSLEETPELTADSALFQKNFKLTSKDIAPVQRTSAPKVIRYGAISSVQETEGVASSPALVKQHVEWLPKKYSLEKGVYTDFSRRTLGTALVGSPLILLFSVAAVIALASNGPSEIIRHGQHSTTPRKVITTQNASVEAPTTSPSQAPTTGDVVTSSPFRTYRPATTSAAALPVVTTPVTNAMPDTSAVTPTPVTPPIIPTDPTPVDSTPDPTNGESVTVVVPVPIVDTTLLP
jgi:hypothetical protein